MQQEKGQSSTRILPVTLCMLGSVVETSQRLRKNYKNANFEFLCFVARLVSMGDTLVFSDETGLLHYDLRITQTGLKLKPNLYYQCLCRLKSMDTTFKVDIVNLHPVDGNYITLHMAKAIRKDVELKAAELLRDGESSTQPAKASELLEIMKQWSAHKGKFTAEELEQEFLSYGKAEFECALEKMEDDQLVGNMGEYYQWISW